MKKLAAAVVAAAVGVNAHAGIDTIVHFANLSPLNATVSFAPGDNTCWYDTSANDDGRIAEYYDYYRRAAVSSSTYTPYLNAFNNAYGITDLATIQTNPMNTSVQLPAIANGSKVQMAIFQGETSANWKAGCKNATSSRGFDITLTDSSGTVVSTRHYVLSDPPGSQWRLMRMTAGSTTHVEQDMQIGSGGTGSPLEIAALVGTVVVTVVTIGTGGPEAVVLRTVLTTTAREMARAPIKHLASGVLFYYVFTTGLDHIMSGSNDVNWTANRLSTVDARIIYTSLVNGSFYVYRSKENSGDPLSVEDGEVDPVTDFSSAGIDYTSPSITRLGAVPKGSSNCSYETATLGVITECRVVGIDLAIMPDGSLVHAPLPSVGSGK